jgi:transposase
VSTPAALALVDKVIAAAKCLGLPPQQGLITEVIALLARVNPNYPSDALKPLDCMNMILGHPYPISTEEIDIIESWLPPERKDQRILLRTYDSGLVVTFHWCDPYSEAFRQFEIRGTGSLWLPLNLHFDLYVDMDDLENHWDECPSRLSEDNPEWSEDCNCEAYVLRSGDRMITDVTETGHVRDWIMAIIEPPAPAQAEDPVQSLAPLVGPSEEEEAPVPKVQARFISRRDGDGWRIWDRDQGQWRGKRKASFTEISPALDKLNKPKRKRKEEDT